MIDAFSVYRESIVRGRLGLPEEVETGSEKGPLCYLADRGERRRWLMRCLSYQRFQVAGLELFTCQDLLDRRQLQDHP